MKCCEQKLQNLFSDWLSVRSFSAIITFRHYYNMPYFYRVKIRGLKSCLQYLTDCLNYLLTYLFTAWSRVLLGKLIGSQLVKKFPAFYGAEWFIIEFTSARHMSLSWARSIQSIPPHPTSRRSMLILSSHLRLDLPSGLFSSGFPYALRSPPTSFFSIWSPEHYWVSSTDH